MAQQFNDNSPRITESLISVRSEMEDSRQGIGSENAVGLDFDNVSHDTTPTGDQYFLLHFIMGTYFGPDLKDEPLKSVWQRCAEGLPPYTSDHLVGSRMKTDEVERIYYYILRKADRSVVVKLPWLQQFLHGNLPSPMDDPAAVYPQFDALFPPWLHLHSLIEKCNVIENIAFISDPEVYYIKQEDIERFKRLTRLEHLHLDEKSARTCTFASSETLYNVAVQLEQESVDHLQSINGGRPVGSAMKSGSLPDSKLSWSGAPPFCGPLYNATPLTCSPSTTSPANGISGENNEQGILFLPGRPSKEEWNNLISATKRGFALTGTAATGQVGPILGLVDIGESHDSYLFRVTLPGVKRDEEDFSCEVENDGKVLVKGVTTTGETTVHKYSQVFEMQSQNLCPSGPFSISFKLPGPVDPQHFSGNFGTDGILEGIVLKAGGERW